MKVFLTFLLVLYISGCTIIEVAELESTTSWRECYLSFNEHVFIGKDSDVVDCGFFKSDSTQSEKVKVKSCTKVAIESQLPFKSGHQGIKDDSEFCNVAIRDSSGRLLSLFYEFDISGVSSGTSALWVSECKTIFFESETIDQDSFFYMKDCKERNDLIINQLHE